MSKLQQCRKHQAAEWRNFKTIGSTENGNGSLFCKCRKTNVKLIKLLYNWLWQSVYSSKQGVPAALVEERDACGVGFVASLR
jgi:hypothetical protein